MRKDVRIGLSIGGVLLAVLIVYLLVPKDANTNRNAQQVAQKGTQQGAGASAQSGGDASGQGTGATEPGQTPAHIGGVPGDSNPPQPQQDPNLVARGPGATTGVDGTPSTGSPSTGGTDQPAQADAAAGGVDWATILNRGVMPESMMATKHDPFADETKHAETPRNTPGPQPDWMNTGPTGTQTGGTTGQTAVAHPQVDRARGPGPRAGRLH